MSFAQVAIELFKLFPFLAAACATVMAMRAVVKGEVVSTSRVMRRTLYRSVNPIQFWMEIGLYGITVIFLLLLGLLFFDIAPNWFYGMLHLHKPGHA